MLIFNLIMIITTTFDLPDKKIKKILGVVKGNTIRARWLGRDVAAGLKTLIGGEVKSYTDLISKARDEAIQRMIENAKKMGADAVVGMRLSTTEIMKGTSEVLAYGTAVKF